MSIVEKYSRSVTSSNLKDDAYSHATDVLAAIAVSPVRLASELYRVKYCNDATTYRPLLTHWTNRLTVVSQQRKWPSHISPHHIARLSVEYWLNPVCTTCHGRGNNPRINERGGLETVCVPCAGSGIKDITADSRVRQYVVDAVSALNDMERIASREAGKIL